MFLEFLAVDLGIDEDRRQVVRRVLLALGDQLAAALEDLGDVLVDGALEAVGFRSGSAAPSVEFISLAQIASSSSAIPMKLPITRETIGWATSLTRSQLV